MEKVLIVSQTCPRCFSLLNSIYQSNLYETFENQNITIVYYNEYLKNKDDMMKAAVEYLKAVDAEKYADVPYVTPVLIQHASNPKNSNIIAIGESGIFNYLKGLQ